MAHRPAHLAPRLGALLALLMIAAAPPPATVAQTLNPVFVDDSTTAADTVTRVREFVAAGNLDEAARVLQGLLDDHAERVIATPDDPELFETVRARVHRTLLEQPDLFARYRARQGPIAERLLENGDYERVERSRLLTPAGIEAALRLAQRAVEDARFETARMLLEQLENHPDRRAEMADHAAHLLTLVASYLDRPEIHERAARWRAQTEHPDEPPEPLAWPAPARTTGLSPLDRAPETDLDETVSTPLWSAQHTQPDLTPDGRGARTAHLPRHAIDLCVLPAAAGDTLLINDGDSVTAFDRITLAQRWRVEFTGAAEEQADEASARLRIAARRGTAQPEDLNTVAVQGRTAVAATGLAFSGARLGDSRVHAFDTETGRVLWSVDPASLDPALEESSVRGPIVVTEGLAIVSLRKFSRERRLLSLSLAALDLNSGELVWRRLVGSVGSLPFIRQSQATDGAVLHNGVVYRSDRLGVVGAYEAGTGRPLWVRRMPVPTAFSSDGSNAWQMSLPIVHGASLILPTPDRRTVVRLDRKTGQLLGERTVSELLPGTQYLLRSGDNLVAVSSSRVALLPIDDFESARPVFSDVVQPTGLHGRVVVAGDKLIAPIPTGVAVFRADRPDIQPKRIDLEYPGNILALGDQIVATDDARVHGYLIWEIADKRLTERMQADPGDPVPAAQLAELAHKSGRPERIVPATDAAIAALERAPETMRNRQVRASLFRSLMEMIADHDGPAEDAPADRVIDDGMRAAIVERMGRLAVEPDETVAHLLAAARLDERAGRNESAVDAYQRILEDPDLAGATWRIPSLSVRAEFEATRRVESVVRDHGPAVYAHHAARAERLFDSLDPRPEPARLESLARRFPMAPVTPAIWAELAAHYERIGEDHAHVRALEAAVHAARRIPETDRALHGELVGRFVRVLEQRRQLDAAMELVERYAHEDARITLTYDGEPLDADSLASDLRARIAALYRWPRVGAPVSRDAQILYGYTLMSPLLTPTRPTLARAAVLARDGQISLWAADPDEPDGPLRAAATTDVGNEPVELVAVRGDAAILYIATAQGGVLQRIEADPDRPGWRTEAFQNLFEDDPDEQEQRLRPADQRRFAARRAADRVQLPVGAARPINDLVVAMDERTIAVVERTGRAAAYDADSGAVLWTRSLPVRPVYDIDLGAGAIAVAGVRSAAHDERAPDTGAQVLLIVDARTGEPIHQFESPAGPVHWVRMPDPTRLIAGLQRAVVSLDAVSGRTNWIQTENHAHNTRDAWVVGPRLFVMGADRELRLGSADSGRISQEPLPAPEGTLNTGYPVRAVPLEDGATAFATAGSLVIFGPDGSLQGTDALRATGTLFLEPAPSESGFVTCETVPAARRSENMLVFAMHELNRTSARLEHTTPILLGAPPAAMTLLDGRIALTAGGTTIFLRAPADPFDTTRD